MNRKEYRGSIYSFQLNGESIGSGGNGTVYEVSTVPPLGYPVVAKFFKANKVDREERYKRFRREIETVSLLKDVKGILASAEMLRQKCKEAVQHHEASLDFED